MFMFQLGKVFNNKDSYPDVRFTFDNDDREIYVHKVVLGAHKLADVFNLDRNYSSKLSTIKTTKTYDVIYGLFHLLYSGMAVIATSKIGDGILDLATDLGVRQVSMALSSVSQYPTIVKIPPNSVSLVSRF